MDPRANLQLTLPTLKRFEHTEFLMDFARMAGLKSPPLPSPKSRPALLSPVSTPVVQPGPSTPVPPPGPRTLEEIRQSKLTYLLQLKAVLQISLNEKNEMLALYQEDWKELDKNLQRKPFKERQIQLTPLREKISALKLEIYNTTNELKALSANTELQEFEKSQTTTEHARQGLKNKLAERGLVHALPTAAVKWSLQVKKVNGGASPAQPDGVKLKHAAQLARFGQFKQPLLQPNIHSPQNLAVQPMRPANKAQKPLRFMPVIKAEIPRSFLPDRKQEHLPNERAAAYIKA